MFLVSYVCKAYTCPFNRRNCLTYFTPQFPQKGKKMEKNLVALLAWGKLNFVMQSCTVSGMWGWPQNDYLLSVLTACQSNPAPEALLQRFWGRVTGWDHPWEKKGWLLPSPFFLVLNKKLISQDNSDLSVPARTLERHVQLGPQHCFWSKGLSPCPGVQSPLHTHKHKCTAPQCCCPLSFPALPVGKPKPGSCQFQLRLGHVVLLKKACWLRGILCFLSMGKKKKKAVLRLELATSTD